MTPEQPRRARDIFDRIAPLALPEQTAYLEAACANDPQLRTQVLALLAENQEKQAPPAVGSYRIERQIGAGGMGVVYEARDLRLDRHVALKMLQPGSMEDPDRIQRFKHEARAVSRLNHPNIVSIYEADQYDGRYYIVTEFVEGQTLRNLLAEGPLNWKTLLDVATQIASALAAAHQAGVIHRDLKPENVMLRPDGIVKVLDFGLAKLTRTPEPTQSTVFLSRPGNVAGTVPYLSPEQVLGKPADPRSDLFSFGVLLYELATGTRPFSGPTDGALFDAILHHSPAPPSQMRPHIGPGLDSIVSLLIEKDPELRFQSAEDARLALRSLGVQSPEPVSAAGSRPARSRSLLLSRRIVVLSLGGTALAAAAVSVGYFRQSRSPAGASVAVMPFVNAGSSDTEYLADGITENLINSLARTPHLKVIARSSTYRYRGAALDAPTMAKALNVETLVTGRVTAVGARLRVSVELVNGSDGTHIWGDQYSSEVSGLPNLEAEVVRAIGDRLRLPGTAPQELRGVNAESYALLLRGRYQRRLYTAESTQQAVGYFEQAVALDPDFALAHAELAYTYRLMSGSALVHPQAMMPKAEAAAVRALALDDKLAEAHTALADIKKDTWDFAAAEREYRRALELNPNLAEARDGYAVLLSALGRSDDAIAEIEKMHEIDPVGILAAIDRGVIYYNARRYDQALDALQRAVELDPSTPMTQAWIGIVHGGAGHYLPAVEAFEKAMALGDRTGATQCYYVYSLARSGKAAAASMVLQRLQQQGDFVPPTGLAVAYAGLGQTEKAVAALQTAYTTHDPLLQYLDVESHYDAVRADPRVQELRRRIGLQR